MGKIIEAAKTEGKSCLPFSAPESVTECIKFATSAARLENALSPDELETRIFDVKGLVRLYVVFCPAQKFPVVWSFWVLAGVGISTRLAEDCVKKIAVLREVRESDPAPKVEESKAQSALRERIAELMERVSYPS
jgi:cystathionine gamma-synthase